eukprot:sb/3470043/
MIALLLLLPLTASALSCDGQWKCYGKGKQSWVSVLCNSRNCLYDHWNWNSPVCGSGYELPSHSCNPDWFHGECRCLETAFEGQHRAGEDRCECDLDVTVVAGVSVLGTVCLLAIIIAFIYCKRFRRMKKVANEARVEVRVINRQMELSRPVVVNDSSVNPSAPGEKTMRSPPPGYNESYNDYNSAFNSNLYEDPGPVVASSDNIYEGLDEINID